MKSYKIGFIGLLLSVSCSLFAQNYFDPQPENFMKQLKLLCKENQHDELDKMYDEFEKEFKAKKINEYQLNKMADILNVMYNRKMQVYPQFRNFILAATNASRSGFEEKIQDRWYLFLKGILENAKKGNNKDFNIFIDFSNDLFSNNALISDKAKTYQITTQDISFVYESGKILVKIPKTDIKGYWLNDTTTIFGTGGSYNIMDRYWKGSGGRINWTRVGFADKDLSAIFGNYEIDMTKTEYIIDSARLTYPEYFATTVVGTIKDKITKEKDFSTVQYPQFTSYKKDYSFDKKIAPNVKLSGGFAIKGNDILINSVDGTPVICNIYDQTNTKKMISAEGISCLFKRGQYINVNQARVKIYVGTDSISHPMSTLKYDVSKNEVSVIKDEAGSGRARFRSTLHRMSFDAEMLTWKLDEDHINVKMLTGQGKNAAKFISDNNFDKETYNIARTSAVEFNPLVVLSKMSKDGNEEIPLETYISNYGPSFSASTILPSIFLMEKEGFLQYNASNRSVKVNKDFVDFYQKANQKKVDYDLLRFKSYGDSKVARLSVNSKKMDITSVKKIPFNDSSQVYAYPTRGSEVEMSTNRHLKFNGKLLAGRLDLYGKGFKFNYDTFSIKTDSIDNIVIQYPERTDTATGEEYLVPLTSTIEHVKGELFVNGKFNKSGKESARNYPKLSTYANSYVYYDHPNIYGGIYHRDHFYFELSPFKKDSLLHFDPEYLYYDGKLFSSNIFEPFAEKLKIQKDRSLGFYHKTEGNGISNYKGRGTLSGTLKLSNEGLVGKGILNHLNAKLTTDSIQFFPESANMFARELEMDEQKTPVEFPQVSADSVLVGWHPYTDTMLILSTAKNPFDMFNKGTRMHGRLILESKGLTGSGFLDFDEAKITAKGMKFKSTTMNADTSSMEIKSLGNKVTFKTPNVKCLMNFEQKVGDFKSNDKDISTNFAYNQYKAEINEFRWEMNKKILTFKAKEGTKGCKFTSTHPMQDSLTIYPKIAEYNMLSSVIKMEGVDDIIIADSRVFPDNGKVTVLPEAKIETLKNASIEGDTAHNYHVMNNVTMNIHGKNDMIGSGEYTLKVSGQNYPIKMNSIRTTKVALPNLSGKARDQKYGFTIEGTGRVEKSQTLKIYRNTEFNGNVHIFMNKQYPHFEGLQRIEFTNPEYKSPWFSIDNEVNVAELQFHRDSLKDEKNGAPLYTGFLIDREKNTGWYTNLIAPQRSDLDQITMDAGGMVKHNPASGKYYFGDSAKILSNAPKGNRIIYSEDSGKLVVDGVINPQLKIGGIQCEMAGVTNNDLNASSYKFMGGMGMNITLDQKVNNAIGNFIAMEFTNNKDINYTKKETKNAIAELFHDKDIANFNKEIEATTTIQNPSKYSNFNLFLTDLIMEYDKTDVAFRSKPEFGLSMFGYRPINKIASSSFLEIGYGEIFDYFTIYLKAKSREWIYMSYSDGQLSILSSNDAVNESINAIEPKRRIIRKSKDEYYQYTVAGSYEVESFVKRMGKGGKYNEEEKRIQPTEKPDISEKDVKNLPIIDEKSPELKVIEQEEKATESAEDAELKALEKQLKELEAQESAEKKAAADKGVQLNEFNNENKAAPVIKTKEPKAPKEAPAPTEAKPNISTDEETPGSRETAEPSTEEKKVAEPEKQEEGGSLFDDMAK